MDTGAYMQNQMDDLITNGFKLQEEMFEELCKDIEAHIKERGFTFNLQYVISSYRSKKEDIYICHSVSQVIDKFLERLDNILQ